MIKNLGNGWCQFKFGDFTGEVSDEEDIAGILLLGFITRYREIDHYITVNCRDLKVRLVIGDQSSSLGIKVGGCTFESRIRKGFEQLAKELIKDVKEDFRVWAEYGLPIDASNTEVEEGMEELGKLLVELERCVDECTSEQVTDPFECEHPGIRFC